MTGRIKSCVGKTNDAPRSSSTFIFTLHTFKRRTFGAFAQKIHKIFFKFKILIFIRISTALYNNVISMLGELLFASLVNNSKIKRCEYLCLTLIALGR